MRYRFGVATYALHDVLTALSMHKVILNVTKEDNELVVVVEDYMESTSLTDCVGTYQELH